MKNILYFLVLFCVACSPAVNPDNFHQLEWLVGTWEGKSGDVTFYEHWTQVSDSELQNVNFEMVNGDSANSHMASILVREGDIIYKGSSELKATSLTGRQVIFENKEENRKYIFRLDDTGRWIATLDNDGATVEYELVKTTPLDELLQMSRDTVTIDTVAMDTTKVDSITQ